ncbi:YveK family protein [Paenibacillus chartarius]|uniref:YveK family protein n=1 Tax=Paenibacillus chartarius TaxID=747481 RepID=A0ABV6DKQ8_9BACL
MELELKDYLQIIKRRIWIVFAATLTVILAAGIYSFILVTPIYQANIKLIVNKTNESQNVSSIDINSLQTSLRLVSTYKELIRTPAIMDKVVEKFPDLKLSAEQLSGRIAVTASTDSQVMTLVASDSSPERAAKIVNAVATVFKEQIPTIMKVDNVSILSEARMPINPTPVNVNPSLNLVIALVVGVLLSIGIIFLLEFLDDSIKTEKDVSRHLGIPTLNVFPKLKESDYKVKNRRTAARTVGEHTYASANQ